MKSRILVMLAILGLAVAPATAFDLVWDDEGSSADKTWSNLGNWNPDNLPDDTDDLFIGVNALGTNQAAAQNDATVLDQNFGANSIVLGNGADIATSDDGGTTGYELQVDRGVTVGNGTGSSIIRLYQAPVNRQSMDANTLTIEDGGQVSLISNLGLGGRNAIVEVDNGLLDIQSGGTLYGMGEVQINDNPGVATTLLRNDGTITAGYSAGGIVIGAPASTLQITAINGLARVDLDGTLGNGIVNVFRAATLDIDVPIGSGAFSDAFDGTMNLSENGTLDVQDPWIFRGQMNVNTPSILLGLAGNAAEIAGGQMEMSGGTITLDTPNVDSLRFSAVLDATSGTIANSGKIIFSNDATIGSGVDFQMTGSNASLTVGENATVTINDQDFNADASGSATNRLAVETGGLLDLNLGAGAEEKLDGVITLDGGRLDVTTASGNWTTDRELNLNNTAGVVAVVSGNSLNVGNDSGTLDANLNVGGTGTSTIRAATTFHSDADVNIAADATLSTGAVTFESQNGANNARFTGSGTWNLKGTNTVNETTTIDMAGGTVDLDASSSFLSFANDTFLNADLTINAATMASYGHRSLNVFPIPPSVSEIHIADTATLAVHLDDPNASWTVNSDGIMHYNGIGAADTFLEGSDLNLEGTLNVTGRGISTSKLAIQGKINLLNAADQLQLGGGSLLDPNRIEGGSVTGGGVLSSGSSQALHGFGDVQSRINFLGVNSQLMADDGTLNLSGAILGVGTIGTADSDGQLNVTTPWNTNAANHEVRMRGGQIAGATITNDGAQGINGHGEVTARIRNNTRIDAEGGSKLLLSSAGSDLDGTTNTGSLNAVSANLILQHGGILTDFQGTVSATAGFEVFAEDFNLHFAAPASLNLKQGHYRANLQTAFSGSLAVAAAPDSSIENPANFVFRPTSNSQLDGNLRMIGRSEIQPGATFAGGAALINTSGSLLQILDGAAVDVLVENRGTLALGSSPGQTTGLDFQQTASGIWEIDLEGTGLNDYDRMTLNGLAQLDGELDVALDGGFHPALNDSFTILSAVGGVGGSFSSWDFTAAGLDSGLAWDIVYQPNNVQLVVIEDLVVALAGDYNDNGLVEQADLDLVLLNWGDLTPPIPGGWVNDLPVGLVDQAELDKVLLNWGNSAALASTAAVPEPTSALLIVIAAIFAPRRLRRRKPFVG